MLVTARTLCARLPPAKDCDLYLLVVPSGSSFGSTNQSVSGLGIVQGSSVFVNQMWIHALFQMRLYDGRTLDFIGWKPARLGQTAFMAVIPEPHRQVEARAALALGWPMRPMRFARDPAGASPNPRAGACRLATRGLELTLS